MHSHSWWRGRERRQTLNSQVHQWQSNLILSTSAGLTWTEVFLVSAANKGTRSLENGISRSGKNNCVEQRSVTLEVSSYSPYLYSVEPDWAVPERQWKKSSEVCKSSFCLTSHAWWGPQVAARQPMAKPKPVVGRRGETDRGKRRLNSLTTSTYSDFSVWQTDFFLGFS